MTIVIQTQSGDLVFNAQHMYRRINMIHDPQRFQNDIPEPSGNVYCDEILVGKYQTAERAKQIINDFYIYLQSLDEIDCDGKQNMNVASYRMPKE